LLSCLDRVHRYARRLPFDRRSERVAPSRLGQQIDANGALVLADAVLSSDHFHRLFDENSFSIIRDLRVTLPFISQHWTRLSSNYLSKHLQHVRFDDLSADDNNEHRFGQGFYERIAGLLTNAPVNFDIASRLIPRDSAGSSETRQLIERVDERCVRLSSCFR
jgi:hypothetical protein